MQTVIDQFKQRLAEQTTIAMEIDTIVSDLEKDFPEEKKDTLRVRLAELHQRQDEIASDPNAVYLWHSLEPLGKDNEHLASKVTPAQGHLCVCINTENSKFKSFDQNNNALGMALHIAECMIRELIQIEHEGISKELLDTKVSAFYATHFSQIASMNLMDVQ